MSLDRAEREQIAYDENDVFENSVRWHRRVIHVVHGPNTMLGEERFEGLAREAAAGGRVLDVGCGRGESSKELLELGAAHVRGVDVSQKWIGHAKERYERPGVLEYACLDVTQPFEGTYDLIFGRSILHHLDYRPFLERVYRENLAPGGVLLFMEPLGSNVITKAFHALVKSAHTPDERPFETDDLDWLRRTFPELRLIPINFLSYPVGIASSLILRGLPADNAVMRGADRIDRWVERRPRALPQARQLILHVHRPADA
jgi:SAM-dependent methyltransferase